MWGDLGRYHESQIGKSKALNLICKKRFVAVYGTTQHH
jgi:hypothetical protein